MKYIFVGVTQEVENKLNVMSNMFVYDERDDAYL